MKPNNDQGKSIKEKGKRAVRGLFKTASVFLPFSLILLPFSLTHAAIVTPHDTIPDFCGTPTKTSVASGNWSDPATWGGTLPQAGDEVVIAPGHTVTFDVASTPSLDCVGVKGVLTFRTDMNTQLLSATVLVYDVGQLNIGTTAAPVNANNTAEIVIANRAINLGFDPDEYGTALIALGKVTMHGSIKTPTWTRVATEPKAGNTTLTLSEAVTGWRPGDRLVLPDTRHIQFNETPTDSWKNSTNQWEELTVQSVSADGKTITLTSALAFNHNGARDLNGVITFLPHVGNLTRNVIVRSESATGTRGHTLFTRRVDLDIRYALFKDLGRTTYQILNSQGGSGNHIGRYPIHVHHVMGPTTTPANGNQFTLLGNAVDGGSTETKFKWGITIHDSHYGLIQDNVVYNFNGSAIATEDGSESFDLFNHNFAMRGIGEPINSLGEARFAEGTEGVGFWFRGPNNYVTNNVAANFQNPSVEASYGFAYQFSFRSAYATAQNISSIKVPNFKGADTTAAGQFTTRDGNAMPILLFDNNEAYGAMQGGFTIWWAGSLDPNPKAGAPESVFKNLKIWHTYNKTLYMYPAQKVTFDGLVIRSNFSSNARCCGNGVYFADYSSKGIIIRNSDIQGANSGIVAPEAGFGPEPQLTIQNTYLRNWTNLEVPVNGSVNGCWMDNKLIVAQNVQFDAPPGRSLSAIEMVGDVATAPTCLSKLDEMRMYSYNGVATDNFQVYSNNTSVVPRPPASCNPTTRAGISGLLCPIAAITPPPPPPPSSSACDLNGDGTSNISDIQLCVNQAIGVASCLPSAQTGSGDINKDGACNVIDVQRVVNTALGGPCVSP